ncbi:DUF6036 family nucleotidyltransferase [Natroniella sulfidigena]|uniref:DUF6036 family nucleotidyltransferase n=1 Tax=Natroniella sulfidigena TaxID=723921 RepID=UPI00200B861D|nr:DUF6036 family nucleotidyltransferase [Natroniella sulfidigena]MCK8816286.1 DUF6036 family nucleotidyltransferase [Natroniella sulfidigena]
MNVTQDIDTLKMDRELRNYLSNFKFDLFGINDDCNGVIMLHPDYEERLEKLVIDYDFKFLDIFILGDYDLIITKIGRGRSRDFEDVAQSGILESINKNKLDKLMRETISFQIGQGRIQSQWEAFKNQYF